MYVECQCWVNGEGCHGYTLHACLLVPHEFDDLQVSGIYRHRAERTSWRTGPDIFGRVIDRVLC
jgi:hypothetical protein